MKKKHLIPAMILSLSAIPACNLFSGLSKPSNDEQYLIAARACLDHGDYDCALSNYRALSDSKNDEKWSELTLTQLAQLGVFSFSDLIGTLGSSRGSGASFASMANLLAQRGKTTAEVRQSIQEAYAQNNNIQSDKLKGFSKFLVALSMMNSILANIAGGDQLLNANDLLTTPGGCSTTTCLGDLTTPPAACADPNPGSGLENTNNFTLHTDMNTLTDWTTTTDVRMLLSAIKVVQVHMDEFAPGTSGGLFDAIDQMLNLPVASDAVKNACMRAQLAETLGL